MGIGNGVEIANGITVLQRSTATGTTAVQILLVWWNLLPAVRVVDM